MWEMNVRMWGDVMNECENEAPTWFPKILTRKRNNRTTYGSKIFNAFAVVILATSSFCNPVMSAMVWAINFK
jgi:hypothetical protein